MPGGGVESSGGRENCGLVGLYYMREESVFNKKIFHYIHVYICVSVCMYDHLCVDARKGQKRASDFPEQELQVAACCIIWV